MARILEERTPEIFNEEKLARTYRIHLVKDQESYSDIMRKRKIKNGVACKQMYNNQQLHKSASKCELI